VRWLLATWVIVHCSYCDAPLVVSWVHTAASRRSLPILATKKQNSISVGFEVLTTVVRNAAIFWDIAPCIPYIGLGLATCYTLVSCSDEF
jgi:hypothetical protein